MNCPKCDSTDVRGELELTCKLEFFKEDELDEEKNHLYSFCNEELEVYDEIHCYCNGCGHEWSMEETYEYEDELIDHVQNVYGKIVVW